MTFVRFLLCIFIQYAIGNDEPTPPPASEAAKLARYVLHYSGKSSHYVHYVKIFATNIKKKIIMSWRIQIRSNLLWKLKTHYKISSYRSGHKVVFCKNVLLTISQNSQENTCARVFFKRKTLAQVFSWEFCEFSRAPFFIEQLRWLLL